MIEIVVRKSGNKDDGFHFFETSNPLSTFRPLTANVEHAEVQGLKIENLIEFCYIEILSSN